MRKLALLCFLLVMGNIAVAQSILNKDSLLKLLPVTKEDSNKVLLYISIGQQYESNTPDLAKHYYRMAKLLSERINYPRGIVKFITNYTFILNMQGLYDSSLLLNLQSVEISGKIKDSLYLAKTLFNTGTSYRNLGNYEKAVLYYEEAKKIFERFGDEATHGQGDDVLQLLYADMHQYDKAIQYGERAVSVLRKLSNTAILMPALSNLGNSYVSINQFEKAATLYKEALEICKINEDKNGENSQYLNLGNLYLQKDEYDKVKPYMDKSLQLSKELGINEGQLIALKGLSLYYQYKKDYTQAEAHAKAAMELSFQYNLRIQRQKVLDILATIAYSRQDMMKGEYYTRESVLLSDSLLNEMIEKNTLDLERKYETEKKENRIQQLEDEKKIQYLSIRQKNILNYFLMAAAVALLIISLLSYRNYKQKQGLQQRRIADLEIQQQLNATEAVLKGEEQERSRLARDLHDGLGGMLSGIKYSFNSMKGNLILTPENAQAFGRSMDMLDSSIKEMRRVAHNMMPEALVKFGLDTALKDFCNDINQSGALKINYVSIGMENTVIDQTTAITVYRVVQELLSNVIKHAGAETAIVQVSKSGNILNVTVEDDGKGFDINLIQPKSGIGWQNIRSRVGFLKGKIDLRSDEGKGTSVNLEFDIPL